MEGDTHDIGPTLPANKPSIILFVDRLSNLSETRGNSKEALDAFRELALDYHISNQVDELKEEKPEKSLVQHYQALGGKVKHLKHPRLKLSLTAQKIKLKEKLSTVMIINDDKHVTLERVASNLEGSSLHKVLANLLRQNKEGKLSSLAKELGFQLLSDDLDIKPFNMLPSQTVQSNQVSPAVFREGLVSDGIDLDKDQIPQIASSSAQVYEGNSELTDGEPSSQENEAKTSLISGEAHQSVTALGEISLAEDLMVEENFSKNTVDEEKILENAASEQRSFSNVDVLGEKQLHFKGFEGSFFFSDGNYRLLRALTGDSRIPSLVIIDPVVQQHYVLPQESDFSYSSLADFLGGFLNGRLVPYQRSECNIKSPREATRPPFVNVDFHEVDSIPRAMTDSFFELVHGFNQSNSKNAVHMWNQDVLVLFSNNWCGFCQRMELVVREVYRALKGCMNVLMGGSSNGEKVFSRGKR